MSALTEVPFSPSRCLSPGGVPPARPGGGGARPPFPPRPSIPGLDGTPLEALRLLSALDPAAQHAFLDNFGQQMVARGAANCNVFGGEKVGHGTLSPSSPRVYCLPRFVSAPEYGI
jgi:hypothetical protein